jgi:hypothetical protein
MARPPVTFGFRHDRTRAADAKGVRAAKCKSKLRATGIGSRRSQCRRQGMAYLAVEDSPQALIWDKSSYTTWLRAAPATADFHAS